MKLKQVQKVLKKMGEAVVVRSRYNLTRKGVKKGNLYNSISSKVKPTATGVSLTWAMETYGMFLDAGVWGADPSKADSYERTYSQDSKKYEKDFGKPKYTGKQKGRITNSVFTSGAGKIKAKFQYKGLKPPMSALKEYIKENNLRFRTPAGSSEGGQFRKGGQETMAFWMQNRIWAQGITPTLFFTDAFRPAYKRLPKELSDAFVLEIKALMDETILKEK